MNSNAIRRFPRAPKVYFFWGAGSRRTGHQFIDLACQTVAFEDSLFSGPLLPVVANHAVASIRYTVGKLMEPARTYDTAICPYRRAADK